MPATAEPPADVAAPAIEKSFFNDNLDAEFQKAIDADAEASKGAKPAGSVEPPKPAATAATAKEVAAAAPTGKEDDMPGDIKSEAGQSSWKKLKESKASVEKERDTIRGERDELRTKFETASKRMEELEKAAKTPAQQAKLEDLPEYKQLKEIVDARTKELEEYSERLRLVNVEQHPKFQAYFNAKTEAQLNIAKKIGGDKLVEVLKLPDNEFRKEKLNEIALEMQADPVGLSQLGTVLGRLAEIQDERQREIGEAKSNYQKILAEQQQAQEKERLSIESQFKQITDEVTSKDKGLSVFHEREGDAEWNSGVKERLAVAQAAFAGKLKPADLARNAYWGAAAPVLLTELNGANAKVAALEQQLSELRAAGPAPGGARPGSDQKDPPSEKKGLDALMETFEREGAIHARR